MRKTFTLILAILSILMCTTSCTKNNSMDYSALGSYSDALTNYTLRSINYAECDGTHCYIDDRILYWCQIANGSATEPDIIAENVTSMRMVNKLLLYLGYSKADKCNNIFFYDFTHMRGGIIAKNVCDFIIVNGEIVFKADSDKYGRMTNHLYHVDSTSDISMVADDYVYEYWQFDNDLYYINNVNSLRKYSFHTDETLSVIDDLLTYCTGKNDLAALASCDILPYPSTNTLFVFIDTSEDCCSINSIDLNSESLAITTYGEYNNIVGITKASTIERMQVPEVILGDYAFYYPNGTEKTKALPYEILDGYVIWPNAEYYRDHGFFYVDDDGSFAYMTKLMILESND